jgi:uncharacterized protein YdeI (YjbR/CyaY-like superfamily)
MADMHSRIFLSSRPLSINLKSDIYKSRLLSALYRVGKWPSSSVQSGEMAIFFCKGWENGSLLLYRVGKWLSSSVLSGEKALFFCKGWENGSLLLYRVGKWLSSSVQGGKMALFF